MKKNKDSLSGKERSDILQRFIGRKPAPDSARPAVFRADWGAAYDEFCRFERFAAYEKMMIQAVAAEKLGLANPFFRVHDGVPGATTRIAGKELANFSSYNYLGLTGDSRVNRAAAEAMERYGTSAGASRLVAGERPVQRELETALAAFYDVDDCIVYVSGHATNVSTIGHLFGPKDLIVHDALIHNSILEGARLSGATRRPFPHNDPDALDSMLAEIRGQFERVLIAIEGHYSMDGDIPDLPRFIDIKSRHKAFLMVDEAHALGVLGKTGGGVREHFGVAGRDVDIWMGTLSKSLASCGGYICGNAALVSLLKYGSSGFVYSVGISPPLAAAALEALRILGQEPERVGAMRQRAAQFLDYARQKGLDTGLSAGYSVIPVIIGNSLKAVKMSNKLSDMGVNVQPIIHPAVEERAARLRFFITSQHTAEQVTRAVDATASLV